jgi:hypothetical protein
MISYLACPYTHEHDYVQHRRYEQVTSVAAQLMSEGQCIYSPITSMHYLSRHLVRDGDFWLQHDLTILSRCDKLIVLQLDGWEQSVGLKMEIEFAKSAGIPIEYLAWSR